MALALVTTAHPSVGRPPPSASPSVQAFIELYGRWLEKSLPGDRVSWFRHQIAAISADERGALIRAVGLAPRKLGKADLAPDPEALRDAAALRPGFDATGLSVDQAARIAFVLASYRSEQTFAVTIEDLCRTADVQELIAYYRGLAIFPAGESLRRRAAEGVRSAIKPIFEAVAHRNPYPREHFDEPAWNQMVLKALFIGSALAPIQGLDERANADLAAMLVDYAHERWAAGRAVSPELWRCVGPFAGGRALDALERTLEKGSARERQAAALALQACPHPDAAAILDRSGVAVGPEGWDVLAVET